TRRMVARQAGKVINICSMQSELGRDTITPYAASKGAVKMLTRMVRQQGLRRVDYGQNEASSGVVGSGDSCGGGRDSLVDAAPC
ncbi:SDR family NAD(P)-dependent oxidoreductase, partial [Salmonella enterica subsp. enterica serovar Kentucky]|nr:SDR family NAD(P)-dependent oxidoreductase [Salmonella enterica subsp. enterica serovar Kentucky]